MLRASKSGVRRWLCACERATRRDGKEYVLLNEICFILKFDNSWHFIVCMNIIENIKIPIKKLNC